MSARVFCHCKRTDVDALDDLVDAKVFKSRSEAIREGIQRVIEENKYYLEVKS